MKLRLPRKTKKAIRRLINFEGRASKINLYYDFGAYFKYSFRISKRLVWPDDFQKDDQI